MRKRQQTVEIALDSETGDTVEAGELLSLPEAQFTALRRQSLTARNARRRGDKTAGRFTCVLCGDWLYLSRHVKEEGNRWFVHDKANPRCEWSEGPRLSPDARRALIYRGYQEGKRHKELKEFIAKWLRQDAATAGVDTEKVTFSQVAKGEWKRPDVRCTRGAQKLVFELQLNYTFLTDVLKREEFYQREGMFILWVFASFDLRKSTVIDQAFHGLRNVLVLDADAIAQTEATRRLTFTGHYLSPVFVGGEIVDAWEKRLVTLDDLRYPATTYRAFFFDYFEAQRDAEWHAWRRTLDRYLNAAIAYYDGGHSEVLKRALLAIVDELYRFSQWHRGFEVLRSDGFMGYHGVLSVLLSIKHKRPMGYWVDSVYRVLESGVRQTVRSGHQGYAILYFWAWSIFGPASVSEKQKAWIRNYAHGIKRSIEANELTYARFTSYDEAIGMLFPELEEKLCSPWGVVPPPPGSGIRYPGIHP